MNEHALLFSVPADSCSKTGEMLIKYRNSVYQHKLTFSDALTSTSAQTTGAHAKCYSQSPASGPNGGT